MLFIFRQIGVYWEIANFSGLYVFRGLCVRVRPLLDPFEGSSNDAISLNGYGYASANPINLTDPSGFSPEEDFWAGFFLHSVVDALSWEVTILE